jgi:hypothetical protein
MLRYVFELSCNTLTLLKASIIYRSGPIGAIIVSYTYIVIVLSL